MILEKLSSMVNPKKNLYRSTWELGTDKIIWQNWDHGGVRVEWNWKGRVKVILREWMVKVFLNKNNYKKKHKHLENNYQ